MSQTNSPELHVGANVYTIDGEKVGKLRFIMVDPDTASISHLVLEKSSYVNADVPAPAAIPYTNAITLEANTALAGYTREAMVMRKEDLLEPQGSSTLGSTVHWDVPTPEALRDRTRFDGFENTAAAVGQGGVAGAWRGGRRGDRRGA